MLLQANESWKPIIHWQSKARKSLLKPDLKREKEGSTDSRQHRCVIWSSLQDN